ncbi:helix-turn-helix transcriptional regulator [Paraburkholderia kururiensis]|uniref:helix-turn-helix transcriptional regulator n=1 Tax=Paraburkholderia kururiensis TaxID=984307 RepID=UPI000F88F42D|nr:YafY family protein [Paraburkholderia kururiensis]
MRTSRLISMLLLLQGRGRVTAQALADEFEISIRTVYRDIDQLSAAGVPVYADRGPGGGFALLDGYRTPLADLTRADADTLALAGLGGAAADLGLADELRAAQLKLIAAAPGDGGAATSRIGARLHIDPVDWYKRPAPVPLLPQLASAVWQQKRVAMHYRSWQGTGMRKREPLGLVLKAGDWYLVARVRDSQRVYKVANITRLDVLDNERFERPGDFDLRSQWSASVAAYEKSLLKGTARLRVTREGMARLAKLGAASVEQAAIAPADADGWQEVTLPVETFDFAAEQLLAMGPNVEVLAPAELRERLRELAGRVVALNGGDAG